MVLGAKLIVLFLLLQFSQSHLNHLYLQQKLHHESLVIRCLNQTIHKNVGESVEIKERFWPNPQKKQFQLIYFK